MNRKFRNKILRKVLGRRINYFEDGLITTHIPVFKYRPRFIKAREKAMEVDPETHEHNWRLYIALWVAEQCKKIEGDFIECGVNMGFMSRAILDYIDLSDRNFYLMDMWEGESSDKSIKYNATYEKVKKNFKLFPFVKLIKGKIPDTLKQVKSKKVAYLSIDCNFPEPELESIKYFWDKLSDGGIVLLDDYCYSKVFEKSRINMDNFARSKGTSVLALPTGQGMIIKRNKQ